MRIAYLSVSDQLGGSEIALLEMIKGVRRARPSWKLHVIVPGRGPLLDRAEAAGADCAILPLPDSLARLGESGANAAGWSPGARLILGARLIPVALAVPGYLRRLRRIVRAQRPAILHTNGLKAHVLGARVGGRPRVVWHMHEYVAARRLTRSLLRAHKARVAAILANSASVAADVTASLEPGFPVRVVFNAVDPYAFAPDGPAADLDALGGLPRPDTSVVRVGLVATFARWKGHEVFLRALAALPQTSAVRGYIIGAPVYDTTGSQYTMEELQNLARQLGVQDRVGFTGFLPAPTAMRALDVVVHASTRPEPFGLVIAEAMACGRALVSTALGGAAELITSEVDAVTHLPDDADDLARVLARLAADPDARRRLGAQARARALTLFDPDRLAAETVAVYEQIGA